MRLEPAGATTTTPAGAPRGGDTSASGAMPPASPGPARRRRIAGWSAIVVALLLLASIGVLVQQAMRPPETGVLDPQGVGPSGAQALARVLEAEGTPIDRKSTRLNSSHPSLSRMPSSA